MDSFSFGLFAADAPPLSLSLRAPFSILHFLEFAIWGAWWVVLGNYLNSLNFSRKAIGSVYATIPLGAVISPMFIGTIADRYLSQETVLAACHLTGAVLLFWLATISKPRRFYWVALAYALVYSPTLSIVNSIVFRHIEDGERDFPTIRVLGTIGWILAGLSLKLFIKPGQPVNNRPILIAASLSAVLGVFCFFLPHTPPLVDASGDIPFLKAFELLADPSFAVFFGVSFFITIALAFYFSFTPLFLEQHSKVRPENVGPVMTIGQLVEIFFMFYLGWFLAALGMKWVLAIGMAAWGVRYLLFSTGRPFGFVLLGVALHGVCFDFFFAAGFIYVDNQSPKAISASAQSLFAVLTYGLGMWLGSEASGWLNQFLTTEITDPETNEIKKVTNWKTFWLVPAVAVLICCVAFVALFHI